MMTGLGIKRKIQVPLYPMNLLAGDQVFTDNEETIG